MTATRAQNRDFEVIAWGAVFIWWGITELVRILPDGTGAIGIGLILIGLNAARLLNGIPVSAFSTTIGALMLVWGGLDLAGAVLPLPFELPVFAILLITLGVLLVAREIVRPRDR